MVGGRDKADLLGALLHMLATDHHAQILAHLVVEQVHDDVAVFIDLQNAAEPVLAEFRDVRQIARAVQDDILGAGRREQAIRAVNEEPRHAGVFAHIRQTLMDALADLAEGQAGQALLKQARQALQIRLRHAAFNFQRHRAGQARGHGDDHQQSHATQGHQINAFQHAFFKSRRQHHAQVATNARQKLGRALQDGLHIGHQVVHMALDQLTLVLGDVLLLHEVVHIDTVANVRGHAATAGVGMGQQTLVLQVGHGVADGGGAQIQVLQLGQGAAAHRIGRHHEGVDDMAQHFRFPVC